MMRRLRLLGPAHGGLIPSIALTAYTREEDRVEAISAGFTTHISKPADPNALASVIADLARRR